jgi:hypothetical protein
LTLKNGKISYLAHFLGGTLNLERWNLTLNPFFLCWIFHFVFSFLQDIVRKKMSELLILDLHNLAFDAIKTMNSSRSFQIISERQAENARLAFSGVFLFFWGA